MAHLEVTHIDRDGSDPDRRIDRFAGPGWGPKVQDEVIRDILSGRHTYFVIALLWEARLEVKKHPDSGRMFVQTFPDGLYDNNLYELPEIAQSHQAARRLGPD